MYNINNNELRIDKYADGYNINAIINKRFCMIEISSRRVLPFIMHILYAYTHNT